MKILVEALDTYEKKNIRDNELNRIPKPGERFEVTEERLKVLLGNNTHNQVFVKIVEETKTEGLKEGTKETKKKTKKTKEITE